ncbi:enoyl-CoA hydratase-related protein [Sporosarcina luteola]|uniref:enoyl-CoA hydratase/isomerase family protein n=1 Tax=Sporosarcina luteola TaxID=582850 RepID=UPI00203D2474|nr:enoyl-CoA hydratase-related protein [Sporosarcina luteola]MCM3636881.1 enoyl-CoA hydratase-related protein [Sporosarcina luteola]
MRYEHYHSIDIRMNGAVCIVSLNKPELRNALAEEMREELKDFFRTANDDHSIRSIVLTGRGNVFSAGGDLKALQQLDSKEIQNRMEKSQELIRLMLRLQKPVIAAVHGAAAGAGFSLALACDMIIAAKSAVFIQSFVKIAVVPDLGALHFLPQLVGRHKAMELMLLGEKVHADEMQKMDVVNRVVEDEELFEETLRVARQMAENPVLAMGLIKQMATSDTLEELEKTFEAEKQSQSICFESDDFKEGVEAFFEKRKPVYH